MELSNEIQNAILSFVPDHLRTTVCRHVCRSWYIFSTCDLLSKKMQPEQMRLNYGKLMCENRFGVQNISVVEWVLKMGFVPELRDYLHAWNLAKECEFEKKVLQLILKTKKICLGQHDYECSVEAYRDLMEAGFELPLDVVREVFKIPSVLAYAFKRGDITPYIVLDIMEHGDPWQLRLLYKEGYVFANHINIDNVRGIEKQFISMVAHERIKPKMLECVMEIDYVSDDYIYVPCMDEMMEIVKKSGDLGCPCYDHCHRYLSKTSKIFVQLANYREKKTREEEKQYPSHIHGKVWRQKRR